MPRSHTVIIFVVITILYFKAFFGGGLLGSIDLVCFGLLTLCSAMLVAFKLGNRLSILILMSYSKGCLGLQVLIHMLTGCLQQQM